MAGRPTKEAAAAKGREAVLRELDHIALTAAPDAMRTLTRAARGEEIASDQLKAAQAIIDRVLGRPGQQEPVNEQSEAVRRHLAEIRQLREQHLRALQGGNEGVVE